MDSSRAAKRRRVSLHLPRFGRRVRPEVVAEPEPTGVAKAVHDLLVVPPDTPAPKPAPGDVAVAAVDAGHPILSDATLAALVMDLEITEGELITGPPRRAGDDFVELMRETYPSVADLIVTLATEDPGEHVQEWLEVARALSDTKHQRSSSLKAEARERALCVAIAHALEAQARSSARLAGWTDAELENRWEPEDPHRPGQLVWEHYLCHQAELMRATLHGEAVGTWLGALGDLWEAANDLLNLLDAPYSDGIGEARKSARVALRATLVHVQELALW